MTGPTCARCTSAPAAVVTVAALDEGRAASPVAEVAVCVAHLGEVAEALGFERPGDVAQERRAAG